MTTHWRALTEAEIALWPKARLGGALLWIFVLTGVLTLVFAIALTALAFMFVTEGPDGFLRGLSLNRPEPYITISLLSFASLSAILIWGAIMFVAMLARAEAAPAVAAVGVAIVLAIDILASAATQWAIYSRAGTDIAMLFFAYTPMAPRWIFGAAATAGLMGYFLDGVRPNAYFRRRVAVLSAEAM